MKSLLTIKNNYSRYNDKYIKRGEDKLWKVYIKK